MEGKIPNLKKGQVVLFDHKTTLFNWSFVSILQVLPGPDNIVRVRLWMLYIRVQSIKSWGFKWQSVWQCSEGMGNVLEEEHGLTFWYFQWQHVLRCSKVVENVLKEEHVFKFLYGTSSIGGRANNAFEEWNLILSKR